MLIGAICPLKFTDNAASTFGTLTPVSALVFFNFQNGFCLKNSFYVSVIFIFLPFSVCIGHPMRTSLLGAPMYRGAPFSVAVFIFIFCDFLAN